MYTMSARHRVYALNASTGEQIWSFDPFNGDAGGGVGRGVTYWEKGSDKRILFTGGDNLFALNAATGILIESFGDKGKVSMNKGMRGDPNKISVIPTSPGIVFKDLLIIGNEVSELYGAEPGHIRAYNILTGKLEWTFHTVPQPGEPGYDTWPKEAWKYVGGANNWGGMSLDEERGMVFFGTGSPTYDYYGKDRIGMNLFGNSVVALDARTGKYKWHFQTVHHDLWDYDLPAAPNLITVVHNGKKIDAVAQTSKLGYIYTFNRDTGEPLFPIEERPVPSSDIPGEQAWPTQPFPVKPAPYSRQSITKDDISFYTQSSYDSLMNRFNAFRYEGPFTPPSIQGTFMLPGSRGGSSWGGGSVDPQKGIIYVKSNDSPEIATMKKVVENETSNLSAFNPPQEDKYLNLTAYGQFTDANRRPGIKPPWGQLHAINLNTGEYEWSITLGNQQEGQTPGGPETGASGSAGPLVTRGGLLFIGSTRDRKFRAFDQKTGKKLWETTLPGIANANPSTYWSKGKQYIAISVSGDTANPAGYVLSFALPGK
jgi:quinoprotein glucose dehydrogenase